MKRLTALLTLSLLLAHASPADAEWFYDFEDGIPDDCVIEAFDLWVVTPKTSLQTSTEDGVLRLWDSTTPRNGGTGYVEVSNPEVFPGDVRISADINSSGSTRNWFGLWAGTDEPSASVYWTSVNFNPSSDNSGQLHVVKGLPNGEVVSSRTVERVPDFHRSYFLELEVTDDPDDPITGFPVVSARLFDQEGGTLLLESSLTDANLGGYPPAVSGRVGAWTQAGGLDRPLNVTFDNIHAVPEPCTFLLLGSGAISLLTYAWRRRRRPAQACSAG